MSSLDSVSTLSSVSSIDIPHFRVYLALLWLSPTLVDVLDFTGRQVDF